MKKKTVRSSLSAQLSATSLATKTIDGVELVLLPVMPPSPFTTRPGVDSRSGKVTYSYDAEALAASYNASGRKASLGIEHGATQDTRSRGYCVELTTAAREPDVGLADGLYGWFLLSALGAEELPQRLWLYTSAELVGNLKDGVFTVTDFTGHTLTNNPASGVPALLTAEDGQGGAEGDRPEGDYTQQQADHEQEMLKQILEKLGLAEDATAEQIEAAIAGLQAPREAEQALTAAGLTAAELTAGAVVRSEQLVAAQEQATALSAQVGTLTAELTAAQATAQTLTAEVASLKANEAERAVFAAVDAVIAARKATPAQRDSLARIARADLAAFNEAMAAAPAVLAADTQNIAPAAIEAHGLTAEEQATAKAAGISFQTFAAARDKARAQLGL